MLVAVGLLYWCLSFRIVGIVVGGWFLCLV